MKILFTFGLLFLVLTGHSQRSANSTVNYIEFVLNGAEIWSLTDHGHIRIFDVNQKKFIRQLPETDSIILIAKNRVNSRILVTKESIFIYTDSARPTRMARRYKGYVYGIAFDKSDHPWWITSDGVMDPATGKKYFPDSSMNDQLGVRKRWFRRPAYLMDYQDRLWIGFGYGEWGGDLYIFDIHMKKFLKPILGNFRITLNPVISLFSGAGKVYLTAGLAHMQTSGSIIAFNGIIASPVLLSDPHEDTSVHKFIGGEYIGPGVFNAQNNCIYFYSQDGVFKGDPTKDLSSIRKWELVAKPVLHWSIGQPDAVGSPMNVKKIEFTLDGRLVFVSQLDGIGIIEGSHITFLR